MNHIMQVCTWPDSLTEPLLHAVGSIVLPPPPSVVNYIIRGLLDLVDRWIIHTYTSHQSHLDVWGAGQRGRAPVRGIAPLPIQLSHSSCLDRKFLIAICKCLLCRVMQENYVNFTSNLGSYHTKRNHSAMSHHCWVTKVAEKTQ